jgi:putative ABC transport system permease protein
MSTLKSGGRGSSGQDGALRNGLVVAELAFAVVLLVGAGLLLRSFLLMQQVELGFRSQGVVTTAVFFPRARYQEPPRAVAAIDAVLTRLRANPEVRAAEATDVLPMSAGDQDVTAIPVGMPARNDAPGSIWYRSVTPGYLQLMQMRLVSGRHLTPEDREGSAPVGIVNQEAAQRLWPGVNPIGRVLATSNDPKDPRLTVVGVVAAARHDGPNQPFKLELFMPLGQFPSRAVNLVIEPSRDAPAATAAFRRAIQEVDPLVPASAVEPIEQLVGGAVALPRLYALLVGIFAGAALLLAVLGVYGVMAHAVAQRQREFGVRLALGAAPSGILRLLLWQGGKMVLLGTGIGLIAAFGAGQLLGALLFGVGAFDLPTFTIVPIVLAGMALLASWLPARRAMRVDPLVAIREE